MTHRFLSASNYMLDAFAISLIMIFLTNETVIPLTVLWLVQSFAAAAVAFFIFASLPYQLWIVIAIAVGTMFPAVFFGASVWIAALFILLSLFRLHARFSVVDDGTNQDGNFMLILVLIFSVSLVIDLLDPASDSTAITFPIVIAAVIFYVLSRVVSRYLSAVKEGAGFFQALAAVFSIIGVSAIVSFSVFLLADEVRYAAAVAAGGILQILLWPFTGLMEKLVAYLSGLSTEPEMQETLKKIGQQEESEQVQDSIQSTSFDFPIEIFLSVILIISVIALIFWLRKVKPEKEIEKPTPSITVERYAASQPKTEEKLKTGFTYGEAELQLVREVFREFDKEARAEGKGRKEFETVREWLERMGWPVSEDFFNTYNLVRYGNGSISEKEALPFIKEIQNLKEIFLKKDV